MQKMLSTAEAGKYAVGYFEAWNLESMSAVIDAAEQTRSPVIIGFGGTFLFNDRRAIKENINVYGAMARAAADAANVPVAIILNEAGSVPDLIRALGAGFNAIMYMQDMKKAPTLEHIIEVNKYIVPIAHYYGAAVEAELGELPMADIATGKLTAGETTDPEQAAYFIRETNIDALAIACGNVHLLEDKKARLDLDLIRRMKEKVKSPLVLHGGTGADEKDIKDAVKLGVSKINVGTVIKRAYIDVFKRELSGGTKTDPHELIGGGGKDTDVVRKARERMTDEIVRFMKIFGCVGKA
jgi:ketose-bisphosphate aldolase